MELTSRSNIWGRDCVVERSCEGPACVVLVFGLAEEVAGAEAEGCGSHALITRGPSSRLEGAGMAG